MYEVRAITAGDAEAAWRLGSLTFGYHDRPLPESWDDKGRRLWGAFESGRMLAKAVDLEISHWFGGRLVPAAGIAGVATAADARGRGLARAVLTRLLAAARERGAAISTLFPTTPVVYRKLGWEEVGIRTHTAVPTASLARPPGDLHTRPATEADVPQLEEIYREIARDSTGMMERSGAYRGQTPAQFLAAWHGVTVVAEAGAGGGERILGYVAYDRGPGYDANAIITAGDLFALTPAATETLIGVLGSWASVAPTTVFWLSEHDPLRWHTAIAREGRVTKREPWMLRLVDAPGAVAARGYSPYVKGSMQLEIEDEQCPWNAGYWRLVLDGGTGRLEPDCEESGGRAKITPRGLALWYAGAASPAQLRRLGLLTGDDRGDALLSVATAGPPPALLDYF